ncbi:hypothetical protein HELRODRAFT_82157, partial [Helobdella robusta]|uniref:Dynamin-like GTPase OPA1, mitochondrial n=1 Tax=Helobdella robusta TaxID=6412 RepID=T1G4N7_HELRO
QIRFQKEIEKLEKENRELKKSLLLKEKDGLHKKKIKRSLIDMYSEVLDSLSDYDMTYNVQDQLPRVVVIGDQSAGKTSVLEMIVQARIFPRGSGEMMTKSPVQVTMSEGPYHVARLKDDAKEYDLTKESDLDSLRREIERRMKSSLRKDQTVSQETVSLSVKGPGLQRMVLVDLPGVISTVTTDMADDTREQIKKMCQHHMSNPNSIILCIQDGSLDAERSNVTDLVSSMDPSGRRTIFVLTKVDLAESMLHNPDRIRKILEGKLFPMKAMGYFAVVTGKGNSNDSIQKIKDYEERFFKQSKLFKGGVLRAHQMGTMNLCLAVSQCFWQMVRQSVEQQADAFKATKFNLETEWKNTYPKFREMDREELYEKARGDILDEVVNLSNISAMKWEEVIAENLWSEVSTHFFENIYLPAAHAENAGIFNTAIDIKLKQWADKILPKKSIDVARETLLEEFLNLLTSSSAAATAVAASNDNDVFHDLKKEIVEELKKRLKWDQQAINSLRVIQMNTLEDRSVHNRQQWDDAIVFMRKVLLNKKSQGEHVMRDMLGPSFWQKYMYWMSRSEEQSLRRSVKNELDKMLLGGNLMHSSKLGKDELIAVRKNLEAQSIDVQDDFIEKTWHIMYRQHFLARRLITAANCQKGFYYYQQGFQDNSVDCSDVVLFWRVERMLQATSKALRQQIMNNETRRLEQDVKQVLDEIYDDKAKMKQLLKGKRVELADEIKKVRHVLELLEEFVQELNKEKT